jgi:hypothetical protein
LKDLFISPFRVQSLDSLGLKILFAMPDRVDRGKRHILVGSVISADGIRKQVLQNESRVGRAVRFHRSSGGIVLVTKQDRMHGADLVDIDETVQRLQFSPGLGVGHASSSHV